MDNTHAEQLQNEIKVYLYLRGDIRPVPVLAPVPLDPGRGGLPTQGLDLGNVSSPVTCLL